MSEFSVLFSCYLAIYLAGIFKEIAYFRFKKKSISARMTALEVAKYWEGPFRLQDMLEEVEQDQMPDDSHRR